MPVFSENDKRRQERKNAYTREGRGKIIQGNKELF